MNTKASPKLAMKIAEFDVKQSLPETFAINERANQNLIESASEEAWRPAAPTGKGRTIAGIASHIPNVRLVRLEKLSVGAPSFCKTCWRKD